MTDMGGSDDYEMWGALAGSEAANLQDDRDIMKAVEGVDAATEPMTLNPEDLEDTYSKASASREEMKPNWGMMIGQAISAGLVGGFDVVNKTQNLPGVLEKQNAALSRFNNRMQKAKKYQLYLDNNRDAAQAFLDVGGIDALIYMDDDEALAAFEKIKNTEDITERINFLIESNKTSGYYTPEEEFYISQATDMDDFTSRVSTVQQQKSAEINQTLAETQINGQRISQEESQYNAQAAPILADDNLGPAGKREALDAIKNNIITTSTANYGYSALFGTGINSKGEAFSGTSEGQSQLAAAGSNIEATTKNAEATTNLKAQKSAGNRNMAENMEAHITAESNTSSQGSANSIQARTAVENSAEFRERTATLTGLRSQYRDLLAKQKAADTTEDQQAAILERLEPYNRLEQAIGEKAFRAFMDGSEPPVWTDDYELWIKATDAMKNLGPVNTEVDSLAQQINTFQTMQQKHKDYSALIPGGGNFQESDSFMTNRKDMENDPDGYTRALANDLLKSGITLSDKYNNPDLFNQLPNETKRLLNEDFSKKVMNTFDGMKSYLTSWNDHVDKAWEGVRTKMRLKRRDLSNNFKSAADGGEISSTSSYEDAFIREGRVIPLQLTASFNNLANYFTFGAYRKGSRDESGWFKNEDQAVLGERPELDSGFGESVQTWLDASGILKENNNRRLAFSSGQGNLQKAGFSDRGPQGRSMSYEGNLGWFRTGLIGRFITRTTGKRSRQLDIDDWMDQPTQEGAQNIMGLYYAQVDHDFALACINMPNTVYRQLPKEVKADVDFFRDNAEIISLYSMMRDGSSTRMNTTYLAEPGQINLAHKRDYNGVLHELDKLQGTRGTHAYNAQQDDLVNLATEASENYQDRDHLGLVTRGNTSQHNAQTLSMKAKYELDQKEVGRQINQAFKMPFLQILSGKDGRFDSQTLANYSSAIGMMDFMTALEKNLAGPMAMSEVELGPGKASGIFQQVPGLNDENLEKFVTHFQTVLADPEATPGQIVDTVLTDLMIPYIAHKNPHLDPQVIGRWVTENRDNLVETANTTYEMLMTDTTPLQRVNSYNASVGIPTLTAGQLQAGERTNAMGAPLVGHYTDEESARGAAWSLSLQTSFGQLVNQFDKGGERGIAPDGSPIRVAPTMDPEWIEGFEATYGDSIQGAQKVFDPDSGGYDMEAAMNAGYTPEDGHWPSVIPVSEQEVEIYGLPENSYRALKGRNHETWNLMEKEENKQGRKMVKLGGHWYAVPKDWQRPQGEGQGRGLERRWSQFDPAQTQRGSSIKREELGPLTIQEEDRQGYNPDTGRNLPNLRGPR